MAGTESNRPATCRDCLGPSHPVRLRIEAERRRLQRAQAVIGVLGYCLNHEAIEVEEAGDVATVAGDLIGQAINGLDVAELTAQDGSE